MAICPCEFNRLGSEQQIRAPGSFLCPVRGAYCPWKIVSRGVNFLMSRGWDLKRTSSVNTNVHYYLLTSKNFFWQLTVCWRCDSWNSPLSITERAAFIWYLDHDGLSNLQPWSWPWSTKAGLNCLSLTNRGTILYSDGASYQAWATVSPIASI